MKIIGQQVRFEDINDDYKQFVEKFRPKKTTDDCYTPEHVYCKKYSDEKVTSWCVQSPCKDEKPSNADRIRAMSDEELAMWINDVTTNALSVLALGSNKQTKNIFHWLDWLKQER